MSIAHIVKRIASFFLIAHGKWIYIKVIQSSPRSLFRSSLTSNVFTRSGGINFQENVFNLAEEKISVHEISIKAFYHLCACVKE